MSDQQKPNLPPMSDSDDVTCHRYEIWALDDDGEPAPFCVGWSNDPDAFKQAIEAHPAWASRHVRDRHQEAPETCQCPECKTRPI